MPSVYHPAASLTIRVERRCQARATGPRSSSDGRGLFEDLRVERLAVPASITEERAQQILHGVETGTLSLELGGGVQRTFAEGFARDGFVSQPDHLRREPEDDLMDPDDSAGANGLHVQLIYPQGFRDDLRRARNTALLPEVLLDDLDVGVGNRLPEDTGRDDQQIHPEGDVRRPQDGRPRTQVAEESLAFQRVGGDCGHDPDLALGGRNAVVVDAVLGREVDDRVDGVRVQMTGNLNVRQGEDESLVLGFHLEEFGGRMVLQVVGLPHDPLEGHRRIFHDSFRDGFSGLAEAVEANSHAPSPLTEHSMIE